MAGQHKKNLSDYIPILKDQGISNVLASPNPGVGLQVAEFTMGSAPDDFVFADNGLADMADGDYHVILHNQSDAADDAVMSAKTGQQFTITGPDQSDVVTLLIVGKLKGQLG
jgi:hypothetical protein